MDFDDVDENIFASAIAEFTLVIYKYVEHASLDYKLFTCFYNSNNIGNLVSGVVLRKFF